MTPGSNGADPIVDPGLQSERTRLAWDRTALSFATVGALLAHAGHQRTSWPALGLGIALICCGVGLYVLGRRRYRLLVAALRDGRPAPCPKTLAAVGALATVATVLSSVTAVLPL
jgi:uncharacterized membrane protein YidH (DUF202 family)